MLQVLFHEVLWIPINKYMVHRNTKEWYVSEKRQIIDEFRLI